MPNGPMGQTSIIKMPREDIDSVARWHRPEWEQFITEIKAYKERILEGYRTLQLRWADERRKCPHCQKTYMAMMKLKKYQLGMLSGFSVKRRLQAGGADCTFTASTVPNLSSVQAEPDPAYCQARLYHDGDWYWSENSTGAWGSSRGTWQGDCATTGYDGRWNRVSGPAPNNNVGGIDGGWSIMTAWLGCGYLEEDESQKSGSFNLELRDGSSENLLFTDSFTMYAEQEL